MKNYVIVPSRLLNKRLLAKAGVTNINDLRLSFDSELAIVTVTDDNYSHFESFEKLDSDGVRELLKTAKWTGEAWYRLF